MGAIWVALDSQLQRRVALKLMASERIASASARHQFEQEAKAVAQLRRLGFKARRLRDGLPEWKAAGLPVKTGLAGEADSVHAKTSP